MNRIDDIIIFKSLIKSDIRVIVDIELVRLIQRVNKLGYQITFTDKSKTFLADKGFDAKYGARPLNRAIQKHVEDLIAENVVTNSIKEGDSLIIDWVDKNEELTLSVDEKNTAS